MLNPTAKHRRVLRTSAVRSGAFLCAALCSVTVSTTLTGCDSRSGAPSPVPGVRITDAPATPDQAYTVLGRIYNIPSGGPTEEFQIAHETIEDFVDINGNVVGMNAMIMPFPAGTADVPLAAIAEGDKVEFTFAVDWDGDPRWVITALTILPQDAEVDLTGVWPDEPAAPVPAGDD